MRYISVPGVAALAALLVAVGAAGQPAPDPLSPPDPTPSCPQSHYACGPGICCPR